MLEQYIINDSTLVLIPLEHNITKVVEKYVSYLVKKNSMNILDESCKFYGSSFQGRCQSAKYLIGVSYKCPIIVSEIKEIIMFPTSSYRKGECMWFTYSGVTDYFVDNERILKIILINSTEINIKLSENIFSNQLFKASRLDTIMKSKKY